MFKQKRIFLQWNSLDTIRQETRPGLTSETPGTPGRLGLGTSRRDGETFGEKYGENFRAPPLVPSGSAVDLKLWQSVDFKA